jgi:hypothetical protein
MTTIEASVSTRTAFPVIATRDTGPKLNL